MLRALLAAIVTLAGVGPVLAAADIDTCRDPAAEPEARLVACSAVTADDTIDIVRDDVWKATNHAQQPFTYGSPPGREDFYFVAGR